MAKYKVGLTVTTTVWVTVEAESEDKVMEQVDGDLVSDYVVREIREESGYMDWYWGSEDVCSIEVED